MLNSQVLGEEIGRLAVDDAFSLGTTLSTDSEIKREGKASIRLSTAWPTTICLGEMQVPAVENAKLVYLAKVKSDKLEGSAFLEMWCQVGDGQFFSRSPDSAVTGTMDWKTLQTPFYLQPGQRATKVTLNIVVNGRGTVWVDDIRLAREALK
jgi:hypothetical protein